MSRRSGPVRSSRAFPAAVLSRHSPSRPAQRKSPTCISADTWEPLGSSMDTSTDLVLREKSKTRAFGPVTRSVPLA